MSLEVDCRTGGVSIAYQREGEGFKYINSQDTYANPSSAQDPYPAGTSERYIQPQQLSKPKDLGQGTRFRVRPGFVFCLGVLVSVLAIVAAGVAGSIAANRGKHVDTCMNTLQKLNATLNANDSSGSTKSSIGDNSSSTTNAKCQNSDAASFVPTSDCTSLSSPYTPLISILGAYRSNNSFNIHCDTDYIYGPADLADFLTFLAFTFEDCIMACASYNQRVPTLHPNSTCYGVTFDNDGGENRGSTCYMKGIQNLVPTSRLGISSSALLITN